MNPKLNWYIAPNGKQVYIHKDAWMGWLDTARECPACHFIWEVVAAIGAEGIECPRCGEYDPFYVWETFINIRSH